jgi:hypothetical protein
MPARNPRPTLNSTDFSSGHSLAQSLCPLPEIRNDDTARMGLHLQHFIWSQRFKQVFYAEAALLANIDVLNIHKIL